MHSVHRSCIAPIAPYTAVMRRGVVLLLLFMTVVSQFLAIAGRADALGLAQDDSHAVLHWKGEAHHHLEDGALQHDASDASSQHLLVDYVLTAPVLLSAQLASLPLVVGERPSSLEKLLVPDPCLPGLKRPPRRTA